MRYRLFITSVLFSFIMAGYGQGQPVLRPGFDPFEYQQMLRMDFTGQDSVTSGMMADSAFRVNPPEGYMRHFRSPEVGLKNQWSMWYRKDHQLAVISIRGTIQDPVSWLANFYAAMVPARGRLQLTDSTSFDYTLSSDDKAMVHVGWLISLGFLSRTMLQEIRSAYAQGFRQFIVTGHSQGGAIAFLASSWLHYLMAQGEIPSDIIFKTYCSAAPKPGNLFYAYDFDFVTRNGWAFNVVNAADWVPESPFSIQTLEDMNKTNPFVHVDGVLQKQSLLVRWYMKGKYNKLRNSSKKAQQAFKSVLGDLVYKQVKKSLPQLAKPNYTEGFNYQRAGVPIVLQPDSVYYQRYPDDPKQIFQHHMFMPYFWQVERYYLHSGAKNTQ